MLIEVDFDSDEAIYIQLCNQIIMGIAASVIREGDSLPSVRQLADNLGKQFGVDGGFPLLQNLPFHPGLNGQLHIVGRQADFVSGSVQEDTLQDGHGGFGRNGFGNDGDSVLQIGFMKNQLHNCG